ncbi:hypothetical protein NliqN6_5060 [Naganishia liquefaciens]|uniref:ERCC4 domain-containing protein n=1 Tax=Naganishia liquefaciens TaxID=104408 RepID=A0A8H3YGE6_9TREE|nr:hypothetical protein NliqN6_5060 [Naganishia liquefaciens]
MPHDIIEIHSDSDSDSDSDSRSHAPAKTATVNAASTADASDVVWDTLDDGWVDRIIKEGRDTALSSSLNLLPDSAINPIHVDPTQSSQISAFTSPAVVPPASKKQPEIIVVDIPSSPVRPAVPTRPGAPRTKSASAEVLALLGKAQRDIVGSESESDGEEEGPISLDFLLAPRVDKGKQRAGSQVAVSARAARPLKRSRTTATDDLSSSPPHPTRRSTSLLSDPSVRAAPHAGPSGADKKAVEARARAVRAAEAERVKADKAREKERDKARALEEKARRKRDQEVNKLRTSKAETVREITVHIDADLAVAPSPLATAIPLLRERLTERQSSLHLVPSPTDDAPAPPDPVDGGIMHVPGLISIKRLVDAEFSAEKRRFVALPPGAEYIQDQLPYIVVITAKELVAKIQAGRTDASCGLIAWLTAVKRKLGLTRTTVGGSVQVGMGAAPGTTTAGAGAGAGAGQTGRCEMMLLIHGMKAFYAKSAGAARRQFAERTRMAMAGEVVEDAESVAHSGEMPDKQEVDKELVRLQLVHRCFQVFVENKNDATEWLYNIAGDIAIRPYRHIQNSHLPFSTRDMPRKGDGPMDTFKKMLQEVTGVTESGAEGIADQWRSFRTLMEGFEQLERRKARGEVSQKDVEGMVSNCVVKALTTGVANARPVGMAVSRHVYRAFRGRDPDAIDN